MSKPQGLTRYSLDWEAMILLEKRQTAGATAFAVLVGEHKASAAEYAAILAFILFFVQLHSCVVAYSVPTAVVFHCICFSGVDLACVGAAIIAGVGAGTYKSAEDGYSAFAVSERVIYPRPEMTERYAPLLKKYKEIAAALGSAQ